MMEEQIEYKTCTKCLETFKKDREFFYRRGNGFRASCILCDKKYVIENSDHIKKRSKEYNERNRDKKFEYDKAWRLANPEKVKESQRKHAATHKRKYTAEQRKAGNARSALWIKNHPEVKREKDLRYRKKHSEKIKERRREYEKKKMKSCSIFYLKKIIRSRIISSFKSSGAKKNTRTTDILGCSIEELKLHIEKQFLKGMSWDNKGEWEIDHIVPLASASNENDVVRLNHYLNLRPLWKSDNRKKSGKKLFLI